MQFDDSEIYGRMWAVVEAGSLSETLDVVIFCGFQLNAGKPK